MRDVSVPAFGSVTPNDMTISPVAIRGRYLRLSASEPCLITGIGGEREKRVGGEAPGAPPAGPAPSGPNLPPAKPPAAAPRPPRVDNLPRVCAPRPGAPRARPPP